MSRKEKVVRVVLPDGINELTDDVRRLLEQFRYAGLIQIHRNDDEGVCFDLLCPPLIKENNREWAQMNVERMTEFGYNAVVAPKAT